MMLFCTNCKLLLICLSLICTHIQSLICTQPGPPESFGSGESRGSLWELSVKKRSSEKVFFPSVHLLIALAQMSELRKTPPLQLLLGKSRKIQLNLLKKKKKRNSCYSERISVLPSVPLEFSVRQSMSNNQEKPLKESPLLLSYLPHCASQPQIRRPKKLRKKRGMKKNN